MKHIVLKSCYDDELFYFERRGLSSLLKRHALLFDEIGILRLNLLRDFISWCKDDEKPPSFPANAKFEALLLDLDWLEKNGIIFDATVNNEFIDGIQTIFETDPLETGKLKELNNILAPLLKFNKSFKTIEETKETIDSFKKSDGILLRMMSIIMSSRKNTSAITTLPYTEYHYDLPSTRKSEVVQIMINRLPLPDNTTAWEKIIDYRADTENQDSLRSLRRWINKITSQNLAEKEIEEELEWLVSEFQKHMKFHKMKANSEMLEVIVKTPLEIIEDLVKLKFSKLPEPLFALKKRQLSLMEAELNAPGREIAYIIKSKEAFESPE